MSEIAEKPKLQTEIANWIRRAGALYCIDLKHIPEGKMTECIGGVCRTPSQFTSEVIGFNHMVAKTFRGEPMEGNHGDESDGPQTSNEAIAAVNESVSALALALENLSDEDLQKVATAPWGEKMTYADFARNALVNMFYHCGQLNYVQAFNGDGDIHWLEAM